MIELKIRDFSASGLYITYDILSENKEIGRITVEYYSHDTVNYFHPKGWKLVLSAQLSPCRTFGWLTAACPKSVNCHQTALHTRRGVRSYELCY